MSSRYLTRLMNSFTTVKSVKAVVAAITEAWQIVPETCFMEEHEVFHPPRTSGRRGGVVLFLRKELRPESGGNMASYSTGHSTPVSAII